MHPPSRRAFLLSLAASLGASLPELAAAQEHARHAAQSAAKAPPLLQALSAEEAAEIEAITAQIIPSDETPGAREAGCVYFMDRALATFASDRRPVFRDGLADLAKRTQGRFSPETKFSRLASAQQIEVLREIEHTPFFEAARFFTIAGFLADPSRGGNRGEAGWKAIGFQDAPSFEPPFGYYDRDIKE